MTVGWTCEAEVGTKVTVAYVEADGALVGIMLSASGEAECAALGNTLKAAYGKDAAEFTQGPDQLTLKWVESGVTASFKYFAGQTCTTRFSTGKADVHAVAAQKRAAEAAL